MADKQKDKEKSRSSAKQVSSPGSHSGKAGKTKAKAATATTTRSSQKYSLKLAFAKHQTKRSGPPAQSFSGSSNAGQNSKTGSASRGKNRSRPYTKTRPPSFGKRGSKLWKRFKIMPPQAFTDVFLLSQKPREDGVQY
ncbi:RNA-binding protein with serine-rich domain 1-like [Littorina saxatilis]|uniref:RNA-binding protein with serine-rich domain 1-like n=1 Tax=Littorina saxatilis TaxID=31220 RepID=UPI0038B5430E